MKKTLHLISFVFLLCLSPLTAQTSLPDSSHVLVVYNSLDNTSENVKEYYRLRRGVPPSNIVALNGLQNEWVTDTLTWESHYIKIEQQLETISDSNNVTNNTQCATKHAWIYFNEKIAKPLANYLNTTVVNGDTLKNTIRYIVLCKGIPFRILARTDNGGWSKNKNVVLDRLLCFLGETINDPDALLDYFYSNPNDCENPGYELMNPYFNADPHFSMDKNFVPNVYKTTINIDGQQRTATLSYLVTHLTAPRYEDITAMIDRSVNAINSQGYDWFIDAHPNPDTGIPYLLGQANATEIIFNQLGITNILFEKTALNIIDHDRPIMTYSSEGVHQNWPPNYIDSLLSFSYADGCIFNTAESFNGYSLGTWPIIRKPYNLHGIVGELIMKGGTCGVAHSFEPQPSRIVQNSIMFPSYALGYNFVESAYLGMSILRGDNVVVGDPLTRIAYPCDPIVISQDTILESRNYDCDIIIEEGVTLTISETADVYFRRNAQLIVSGTLTIAAGSVVYFEGLSELRLEEGSQLIRGNNSIINFRNRSRLTVNGSIVFDEDYSTFFNGQNSIEINGIAEVLQGATLYLGDTVYCKISSGGKLELKDGSTLNVSGASSFYNYGELIAEQGVIMNLESSGNFQLGGKVKLIGTINNNIEINCSMGPNYLSCVDSDTLLMQYATINGGRILLKIQESIQIPRLLLISNSRILNCYGPNIFNVSNNQNVNINFTDNTISIKSANYGLQYQGFNLLTLLRNTISNDSISVTGIGIANNKSTQILECQVNNFVNGIKHGLSDLSELEYNQPSYTEDIQISNCTINGGGGNNGVGISIGYGGHQFSALKIELTNINNYRTGISVNNSSDYRVGITNNSILNYTFLGISLSHGKEGLIKDNVITAYEGTPLDCVGIWVNQVNYPSVINNVLTAQGVSSPGSGILSVSSNGEMRLNSIQYHKNGIELGSSSPKIGANTITENHQYGILINNNSNPDLSEAFTGEEEFPLSGYNTIRENGDCYFTNYSELYLVESSINLEKGCNTIADDREESCYLYLIDGIRVPEISANRNYWGRHPVYGNDPTGRFGEEIVIHYLDYLSEPCIFSPGSGELILADSYGEAYDTLYSTGEVPPSDLPEIETRYASANNYYYHNQYSQAKQEYDWIIQNYGNSRASLQAYTRLFTLANLMDNPAASFYQLKEFYLDKAGNQTDSLMIGTLTHLYDLCLVSAEDYLTAINNFDVIAQQNPNTDIAFYRQIDALTTALLLPEDSTMNKGIAGKYIVNDLSEYTDKLGELIQTRGASAIESGNEIAPAKFALYQNYPNPFNPVTTIKYDLPVSGNVSLIIYDVLGRKVKELVNSKQQAGKYAVQFNAADLASGVYIYQLKTESFMSSKKLMVLK